MKFHGHWVATQNSGLIVTPDEFDETDLTHASNWSEAHQNVDPALPHGYVDPVRVISEVAGRWLALHPEVALQVASRSNGAIEVRTVEDFGLLCLGLAAGLRSAPTAQVALQPPLPSGMAQGVDEIPFR